VDDLCGDAKRLLNFSQVPANKFQLATILGVFWQMGRRNLLACKRAAYMSFVEAMTAILDTLRANRQLS
jgi:hypothetical protein